MILAEMFRNTHGAKEIPRIRTKSASRKPKEQLSTSYSEFLRPAAVVFLIAILWVWSDVNKELNEEQRAEAACTMEIVDDFPENVTGFDYSRLRHKATFEVYLDLFGNAKNEILIMDSSSNLRASQYSEEYRKKYAQRGNEIYELLLNKGKSVKIRVLDAGKWVAETKNRDAEELHSEGAVERRAMDKGKEIQHSKTIIIDNKHTLITSANLDHLSLHQKGELGLLFKNCPKMAADTKQMYENWWRAGYSTPRANIQPFNNKNRLRLGDVSIHTAMSPASLREKGRDSDFSEMVRLINEAEVFVDISVMDFIPFFMFSSTNPPVNDLTDAVRDAVKRGVKVRLITMSRFLEWRNQTLEYLKEVASYGVEVRMLSFEYLNVYMDRKSHGKYIITEKEGLISTSNFTPDYFFTDTGMAVVIKENGPKRKFLRQLDEIFARYWDIEYIHPLEEYLKTCVPVALDKNVCDAINSHHDDAL